MATIRTSTALLLIVAAFMMIAAASATAAGRTVADSSSDVQEMSRGSWKKYSGYKQKKNKHYGYKVKKEEDSPVCVKPSIETTTGEVSATGCVHKGCCGGYICSSAGASYTTNSYYTTSPDKCQVDFPQFAEQYDSTDAGASNFKPFGVPPDTCCIANERGLSITSLACEPDSNGLCTIGASKVAFNDDFGVTGNGASTDPVKNKFACLCCTGFANFNHASGGKFTVHCDNDPAGETGSDKTANAMCPVGGM